MATPAALLGHPYENEIGPFYTDTWKTFAATSAQRMFLSNMTTWNWGVTDAGSCCDDDERGYILHRAIAQFSSKDFAGLHGPGAVPF